MDREGTRSLERFKSDEVALIALLVLIVLGLVGVGVYAAKDREPFLTILGIGVMVAGASVMVGGLFGFLFGIPRSLQRESEQGVRESGAGYQANTNLERISDWLTTMLVGVGLTQLRAAPGGLRNLATYIAGGMGGSSSDRTVAVAVVLHFTVCGFIFSYLWTRLYLAKLFSASDAALILNEREKKDAEALNLVNRQLDPSAVAPPVPPEQLAAAIRAASQPVRVQIFNQARELRKESWPQDKEGIRRTIPVFRALAESQKDNHRYYGQLGFALKDQSPPDCRGAEEALTQAITLRGPERRWLLYEANRAFCWIMLDDASSNKKQPSSPDVQNKIRADLVAVASVLSEELGWNFFEDETVADWMKRNGIKFEELRQAGP